MTNSASTRFDTGDVVETGRALDVAVTGKGYLTVQTPDGDEAYTRAGNIAVDSQGNLSVNGFPLLGENGPLTLPEYQKVEVSERGQISVIPPGGNAEVQVGTMKLVNPEMNQLQKRVTACCTGLVAAILMSTRLSHWHRSILKAVTCQP